jgi:hypothetical protein
MNKQGISGFQKNLYMKICVFLFFGIVLISCSKDERIPGTPPTESPGLMPLKTGNNWVFEKKDFDSTGNLKSTTNDTLFIISSISINDTVYYQQYQTLITNQHAASFFVNIDSNTIGKIDSATKYIFFKRVNTNNILINSWPDTSSDRCRGHNDLFGFAGINTVNGYTGCLKNEIRVTDCTGLTFEKWVYYLKSGLGLVRIEHYILEGDGLFYLQFSEDLKSYSI